MCYINIATEDKLSEAIVERLLFDYKKFQINLKFGCKGNGYLRSKLKNFFEIASNSEAFLLLTDLDNMPCAPFLIQNWQNSVNISIPDNFLFRVTVKETEAWLLADNKEFAKFLGVSKLPNNPDSLDNPKEKLLEIAKKSSKKNIRDDLINKKDSISSQGIGYNSILIDFVKRYWCPKRASSNSESLKRAYDRLKELNDRLQ